MRRARRLCRDLSHGGKVAVKLFKRPLEPELVPQVVQGIAIQSELGEGCVNIISMHSVRSRPPRWLAPLQAAYEHKV